MTGYSAQELAETGIFRLFAESLETADQLKAVLRGQSPQASFETELTTKGF